MIGLHKGPGRGPWRLTVKALSLTLRAPKILPQSHLLDIAIQLLNQRYKWGDGWGVRRRLLTHGAPGIKDNL